MAKHEVSVRQSKQEAIAAASKTATRTRVPDVVDDLTHVQNEIEKFGGRTKFMGSNIHVQCPFHDENSPSCSINLSRESDVPIGAFYCFGCGVFGGWNKFALKAGLSASRSGRHSRVTLLGRLPASIRKPSKCWVKTICRSSDCLTK